MTVVVEIVVETVEAPALIVGQRAVCVGVLCGDARVVFLFLVGILDKEHLVNKSHQGVAEALVLFVLGL